MATLKEAIESGRDFREAGHPEFSWRTMEMMLPRDGLNTLRFSATDVLGDWEIREQEVMVSRKTLGAAIDRLECGVCVRMKHDLAKELGL